MITAKALRKAIGELPFPYYVRRWSDGEISIGATSIAGTSEQQSNAIIARLRELGYEPTCPMPYSGFAGSWIVSLPVQ